MAFTRINMVLNNEFLLNPLLLMRTDIHVEYEYVRHPKGAEMWRWALKEPRISVRTSSRKQRAFLTINTGCIRNSAYRIHVIRCVIVQIFKNSPFRPLILYHVYLTAPAHKAVNKSAVLFFMLAKSPLSLRSIFLWRAGISVRWCFPNYYFTCDAPNNGNLQPLCASSNGIVCRHFCLTPQSRTKTSSWNYNGNRHWKSRNK